MLKFCLLLIGSISLAFGQAEQQALEETLNSKEWQAYQEKTSYKERLVTLNNVLERLGRQLTSDINKLELDAGMEVLASIRTIAQEGIREVEKASNPKDFRSKAVKKMEIRLRKLVQILEDLKLAVPFESRSGFEKTAEELELFRDKLLSQLFGRTGGGSASLDSRVPARRSPVTQSLLPGSSVSPQIRGSSVRGDQFTEEELDKVREAQELVPRVERFLEITESRLTEIERRLRKEEWTKEEPNPLEYYTLAQMVHAYQRALEGIMVNIDDRAKHGTAKQKDIRKSLRKLNKSVIEFLPRLEPLEQLAIDTEDEELYREVRKALKSTETALKGSQMGLGAPAKN